MPASTPDPAKRIMIVLLNPNAKPVITFIDPGLEPLQKAVGGVIESAGFVARAIGDNRLTVYVNEEGKLKGLAPTLPVSGDVLVGPVVFVGFNPATGDEASLTTQQVERIAKFLDTEIDFDPSIVETVSEKVLKELRG